MRIARILAIFCGVYIVVVAAMFAGQTWLIFPAFMVSDDRPVLPPGAVRLELVTADGERLQGIRLPPSGQTAGDKPVIIGFGGNGWHAEGLVLDLHGHFPGHEIVAFNYRGYRPSSGRPSAAALLADGVLIHDHTRQSIGPVRTIAVGYSLGSGVAAYLASRRTVAGLILVTPFDSLEAVAQQRYPWAPVRWLMRHSMSTADFLRDSPVPVAIIAAQQDDVVPPSRTAALRQGVGNLVFDRTIAGTRHNDIFHHPDFRKSMAAAISAIGSPP